MLVARSTSRRNCLFSCSQHQLWTAVLVIFAELHARSTGLSNRFSGNISKTVLTHVCFICVLEMTINLLLFRKFALLWSQAGSFVLYRVSTQQFFLPHFMLQYNIITNEWWFIFRFVKLVDCSHVVEVEGLDRWMEEKPDGQISVPSCPQCKTPIVNTLRYSNVVKRTRLMVEAVKKKLFGDNRENKNKFDKLCQEVLKLESSSKNRITQGNSTHYYTLHYILFDVTIYNL